MVAACAEEADGAANGSKRSVRAWRPAPGLEQVLFFEG
jgi:hypothetical protein